MTKLVISHAVSEGGKRGVFLVSTVFRCIQSIILCLEILLAIVEMRKGHVRDK